MGSLRKLFSPNLPITCRSIIQLPPSSSRFINTGVTDSRSNHTASDHHVVNHDVTIADCLRAARFYLRDLNPLSPVGMMRRSLNYMEYGVRRPYRLSSKWKVMQNEEALIFLHPKILSGPDGAKISQNVIIEKNSTLSEYEDGCRLLKLGTEEKEGKPAVLIFKRKVVDRSKVYKGGYTMMIDLQPDVYDTDGIEVEISEDIQAWKIIVPKLNPERIPKCAFAGESSNNKNELEFGFDVKRV